MLQPSHHKPSYSSFLYAWILCLSTVLPCPGQNQQLHMVPMSDGIQLATDVFLPEDQGPWPVLLARTPYNKNTLQGMAREVVRHGVAMANQDVRGRFGSQGHARPFADDAWGEHTDGLDTVNWLLNQTWCNGRIVTHGGSALGITQLLLAGAGPEGLVGQHIAVATGSLYDGGYYQGGVFRQSLAAGWLKATGWPEDNLFEIRSHPLFDDYWRTQNLAERVDRVNWPVVLLGGWYDIFQQGTLDAFSLIQEHGGPIARDKVYLVIGPWTHDIGSAKVGELQFPENAKMPETFPDMHEWFRYWLLDVPLRGEVAPVHYYTMGELPGETAPGNEWRKAERWPLPAREIPVYMTAHGTLEPDSSTTTPSCLRFTYDPTHPAPTVGGHNLMIAAGSFDQREVELRNDVLVFTSDELISPVELTGRLKAVLYVATTAADTDFTVKLTDVYPDGCSMLITDGIQRLSLRDGLDHRVEVMPESVYRFEVDLWSTSYIFNTDHRIRIAISSSNAPRFEPSPNIGNPDWQNRERMIAEQTVYFSPDRPSHVVLPVVDGQID